MCHVRSRKSDILMNNFVPRHLGYDHISHRDFVANHNGDLATLLFPGIPGRAVSLINATYLPIQRSRNYSKARKSWSEHKNYHLIKMMIVCGADGYILGVHGPYFANRRNNDEAIYRAITSDAGEGGYGEFFQENDLIIWDRGFRFVVELANHLSFEAQMPHFLKKKQRQHSSQEANESRVVTMVRWPIESLNGRIKNVFKYFDGVLHNWNIPNVGKVFRVCCALLNAFHPPITRNAEDVQNRRI